ncbi:MAG: hypothetical protein AB9869_01880 [Verrucomicrobiia bacterium]
MPKDEFDFEDPFELNGMAFATEEDTTQVMAECFAEEFMRMGFNAKQVLALFKNPQYLGPNLALEKHGEARVRDLIGDVFARWGKPVSWTTGTVHGEPATQTERSESGAPRPPATTTAEYEATARDPMGAPLPKLVP